ncbi:RTA1 like family protein [Penicillium digitatum]|uniref:Uncharacterized protein n=3 Tax=Penicillium digitatum TaxID=36651 RepID=K9GNJ3_PEND2|nr:hypothetical protein PDIP_23300 [Penicillium digitatum Pd1]EKV16273.1 hypothetical protein PDIG_21020 [Penicillium digitatum PHI26]EKV19442.1 hypothetical protein PDIP_23300 [Penicillium digitatum Pd1]KAG0153475.1 hypothetical protein PDIDSM_2127 [Penicillium digitatum]QQK47297.1 RTA1 like family protein [Penicillium digitatum]
MPQSSYSSKRAPKSSAKNAHPRPSTPESNIMRNLEMSPKTNQSRKLSNTQASDKKRRASPSSVSSVSSVSSLEDLSDEADDSEEDADDEQEPAVRAPSYGRRRDNKAGRQPTINKRRHVLHDSSDSSDGNDGNDSDVSSDDVYAAVDYITDAEDEEQDVEKMEEMMIVESEKTHRPLPSAGFADDEWAINSFDDFMFLPAASFFDEEQLYSAMETFGEPQVTSEAAETPVARRVHFEERSDSSSDSDSHSDDDIPGDFLQQDSLDPQLRRMIENDNESYQRNTRRQSEEMFGDADYGHGSIYHVESEGSSEGSLSGYESDDGDTTDEDLPPPATITHPRSLLRRDSSDSLAPVDEKSDCIPRRRGPIMGTFVADPHKPVALVDCTGKHLVIIPAYASSRHDWLDSAANSMPGTANTSPRQTTLQLVDESDTDALASPNQVDFSPMLASSANLMMTALGNDLNPGGQVMGPPEAFYPSQDFTIDSSFEEDEEDDPESALNVDDFIDFGNGSSDEDEDMGKQFDDDAMGSPMPFAKSRGTPTPSRKSESQAANSEERFLNHLDKGIVTAFRRNHNRYQALLRLPQHREFMPANSPARPASVFRHAKNNDQRTPTRKRKSSSIAGGEAVRRKLMDAQQRRSQLPIPAPL